jgi:hypothetical protein
LDGDWDTCVINPADAALYAIVAICFVLIGAVLTLGALPVEQRATVLGSIFVALATVAWRYRRKDE